MGMKVTVLIEDTNRPRQGGLVAEHGLSFHIDWNGKNILFDTGPSEKFLQNADKLGINMLEIDTSILSHHHYDHGGGLDHFLKRNKRAQVFLASTELANCYSCSLGFKKRYVGVDRELLQIYDNRFEFIDEFREILPNVYLFPDIAEHYPLPKGDRYLFLKKGKDYLYDDFKHELIMVIKEEDGLVIFTGCSHSGILNMIKTVIDRFQGLSIKALIGGFHLVKRKIFKTMIDSQKEINTIAKEIQMYPIRKIYTGHCTTPKAFRLLKKSLNEKLNSFSTGSIIEII